MTRALPLPARQVTALAKGAAKAGCIAEVAITTKDGKLIHSPSKEQPDHHTFWKARDRNLLNSCEIVVAPEAA